MASGHKKDGACPNDTVDGAEIPRPTTWDVKKPCKWWDKLPTSTGAGFLPPTVCASYGFSFLKPLIKTQSARSVWMFTSNMHGNCVMSGFVRHWLQKYSPCSFKKLFDLLGCLKTLDSFFSVSLLSERLSPVKFLLHVVAIAIQLLADYTDTMVHYLTLSSQVRMDWIILSGVVRWQGIEKVRPSNSMVFCLFTLQYMYIYICIYIFICIYKYMYIYIFFPYLIIYVQKVSVEHLKNLAQLRIPCVRSWLQTHSWGDHPLGWTRGRRRGGR